DSLGLYHFRARHYDPELGRFLQLDPTQATPERSAYQAFGSNPLVYVDPMGTRASHTGEKYAVAPFALNLFPEPPANNKSNLSLGLPNLRSSLPIPAPQPGISLLDDPHFAWAKYYAEQAQQTSSSL